ncbi:Uroporphyrinogen-III synthase [Nakaseomyces bracarensis]|uniref:Uroporphyrinogen-III synthase n=1 Tax=Nakaseomyces bracarensis TaxID=273131 RepID=A0ABR4NXA8_9SACH
MTGFMDEEVSELIRLMLLKNPVGDADPYSKKLQEECSFFTNPIFMPLITHENVPGNILSKFEENSSLFEEYDFLIITSQRSIECLNLPELLPIKQKLISKPTYTVGPATSKFLETIGFTDIRGGIHAGNGMNLSKIIHQEHPNGAKALFLVGETRKDVIPKYLRPRDFQIDEIIMYKTSELQDNCSRFSLYISMCHWIVVFSPQGMTDILEYIKEYDLRHFKIACIGPTTQEYLEENGIIPDLVSPKPDADSLIKAIKSYTKTAKLKA